MSCPLEIPFHKRFFLWSLPLIALCLISCFTRYQPKHILNSLSNRVSPNYAATPETPYCSKVKYYGSSVKITGKAKYEVREVFFSTDNSDLSADQHPSVIQGGLGPPGPLRPIRGAEIKVFNSRSQVIQCSETNRKGEFTFYLPRSREDYYIFINSRAYNQYARASVMGSPEKKKLYSLFSTVKALSDQHIGTLVATADGELLGGAFNILDQVVKTNEFLKNALSQSVDDNDHFSPSFLANLRKDTESCLFSLPLPKVEFYWEPGFNPNSYNNSNTTQSFYLINPQGRVFINGGQQGDTETADTDHYDNAIIVHELSHHIQNFCSRIDVSNTSTGHNGDSMIDPRLAFEEGWANYFQAAVNKSSLYVDTHGNENGNTGFLIYFPIDRIPSYCGETSVPGCDVPKRPGEGNFREISITRFMWDYGQEAPENFLKMISLILTDTYFSSDNYAFRSIGLLHTLADQSIPSDAPARQRLRNKHKHVGDRSEFALHIKPQPEVRCPMSYNITPESFTNDSGSFSTSDLLVNNDFFHYKHSSSSVGEIELHYKTQSGYEANLDLIIYKEFANFGDPEGMAAHSTEKPDGNIQTSEKERVNISSLPSGHYLINVIVKTGGGIGRDPGGRTEYELKLNGQDLCPSNEIYEI